MKQFLLVTLITMVVWTTAFVDQAKFISQHNGDNELTELFMDRLDRFDSSLENLKKAMLDPDPMPAYYKVRRAFKLLEPQLAYAFEAEYTLEYNGAPLPKIRPNQPFIEIIDPKGLQVLDELIGAQEFDKQAIFEQIEHLKSENVKLKKIAPSMIWSDARTIEACRLAIFRMVTLGLSGYDTPGTAHLVKDAAAVLTSVEQMLLAVKNDKKAYKEKKEILTLLQSSIESIYDYSGTPHDFDFASWIRGPLNDLYARLLDYHLTSGLETVKDYSNQLLPINYYESDLFGENLLNISPFVRIDTIELTEARRSLGEMLFYETRLSSNNNRSCASCHDPALGFTDGKQKSEALSNGKVLQRNAPTLINAVYATRFFYDLRAGNLGSQVDHVVYHPEEYNTDYATIIKSLKADDYYAIEFDKAYGHQGGITKYAITNAISQYVASLVSFSSGFDQYMRKEIEDIDPRIIDGFNLFMGKGACATCHFIPLFNGTLPPAYIDTESEVLGVTKDANLANPQIDADLGRMANGNVREATDIFMHSFKTPTVRNIALTAPYMHNGAYNDLHTVLDFYNKGGGVGLGLSIPNQTLSAEALDLSENEMANLILFMESLTDSAFLNNTTLINKSLSH